MSQNIKEKIQAEFKRRTDLNSRYSMRAYAKAIGLHVSIVSRIISGHTVVSLKMLEKISGPLNLSPDEYEFFRQEILSRRETSKQAEEKTC